MWHRRAAYARIWTNETRAQAENTFGNCVKTKFNHHFDQLSAHLIVQLQQIEKNQ